MEDLRPLSDYELERRFAEHLDETSEEVYIAGLGPYETSRALAALDPTAFRCAFADWLSFECDDGRLYEHKGEYYDEDPTDNDDGDNETE